MWLSKRQNAFCEVKLADLSTMRSRQARSANWRSAARRCFRATGGVEKSTPAILRGRFHMGDVFRRNDGSLDFVDRTKYLIKTGGENVYPAEIERY